MIRKFMRYTFPKILDALFILSNIAVILMAIMNAQTASRFIGGGSWFMTFAISACLGVIGVIVGFGVIYVLLDIRDSLKNDSIKSVD